MCGRGRRLWKGRVWWVRGGHFRGGGGSVCVGEGGGSVCVEGGGDRMCWLLFSSPFSVLISLSNHRLICAYVFYQCIYPWISVTGLQGIYFTVV